MAIGDITGVIASLDFDTTGGVLPKIIHVAGTTYAIAYQGKDNDGFLVTVPIQDDGTIGAVIASLEFDTTNGRHPWIIHIAGTVYAIAYQGPTSNGTLKTFNISDDGTSISLIQTFVFDSGSTIVEPVIVHISGTTYAIFYGGPGDDGWVKTVTIQDDGTITGEISFLEFDTAYGQYSDPIHISGDVWAIAYTGDAINGPGRLKTFTITSAGAISSIASYDYDDNQTSPPDLFHISGNVYGIAYGGPGFDGWLKTVTINNDGTIGTVIDSLEFDPSYGCNPWVIPIGENVWAIAHDGPDSHGWLRTIRIEDDGTITGEVDSLEYDPSMGMYQSMIHVSGDTYAIAYFGPGNDGWLSTVEITTPADNVNLCAYIAVRGEPGLTILNLDDLENPAYEGGIYGAGAPNYLGNCRALHLLGTKYCCVAGRDDDRLVVLDISNPSAPTLEGTLYDATYLDRIVGLDVKGSLVYTVQQIGGYLSIIDVSTPASPGPILGSVYLGPGQSFQVKVRGNYAYTSILDDDSGLDGFGVVDISDPENPTLVGQVLNENAYFMFDIVLVGNYAITGHWQGANGFLVIDISDPTNPTIVADWLGKDGPPYYMDGVEAIAVSGNYLYTVSYIDDHLSIFDISDPTSPVFKGTLAAAGQNGIFVRGDYAFTIRGNIFYVVNVSDPENPYIVGTLSGGAATPGHEPYLYLASMVLSQIAPEVTTQATTAIEGATATGNGKIEDFGGITPTQHGHCWATTQNPTTADSKTELGAPAATGAFTSSLTSLSPGTLYYVRAYATNTEGTTYGNEVSFTTTGVALPTVTTNPATALSAIAATLNGTLDDDAGEACDCGFEWGETIAYGNTTPTQSRTTGQTFAQVIAGLDPNKTYHFRAFGTNSAGTSYGADRMFTTLIAPPTVTTDPATTISSMSTTLNGILDDDGGEACQCGFEWGMSVAYGSTTPTQSKNTGQAFSEIIAPLDPDTEYHFRAFAINSAGIDYGADRSFRTYPAMSRAYALSRSEL